MTNWQREPIPRKLRGKVRECDRRTALREERCGQIGKRMDNISKR